VESATAAASAAYKTFDNYLSTQHSFFISLSGGGVKILLYYKTCPSQWRGFKTVKIYLPLPKEGYQKLKIKIRVNISMYKKIFSCLIYDVSLLALLQNHQSCVYLSLGRGD
jgi:hypothetical protein